MRFASPYAWFFLLLAPALLGLVVAVGWPSPGPRRRREAVSLALRLLLILLVLMALAGLEIVHTSNVPAVVFMLDRSDSMPAAAKEQNLEFVRQALKNMPPSSRAAAVVFGTDALVERPMSSERALPNINSVPKTDHTNIANAIGVSLALFPPGMARRIVILSDGNANLGDAAAAAQQAADLKVQILTIPPPARPASPEVLVLSASAPSHLLEGDQFELGITTQASQPITAAVRVLSEGVVIHQSAQLLPKGEYHLSLPLTASKPGVFRYTVQIEPQIDTIYQNNQASAFVTVDGAPLIALVRAIPRQSPDGKTPLDEAAPLLQVLESTQFQVQQLTADELPSEVSELAPFASIILVNVPARDLTQRQMEALKSFVGGLGGGLVTVGGTNSYGAGGYQDTPLEEVLPINMAIRDEIRRPSVSLVLVIDRSGSMAETSGGATKLELAKEAVIRSIEMLSREDKVGVVAFDDAAAWVVPLTSVSEPSKIQDAVGSLRPGGGTDILAGLQMVASQLPADGATVKHIVLLTDGGADPAGIPELVKKYQTENNITLSVIGVGADAAPYLPELAKMGSGRYYFVDRPQAIPTILTQETALATRAYLVEHSFIPQQVSPSPMTGGIDSFPTLEGYVATSMKMLTPDQPGAKQPSLLQPVLVSDQNDPILAAWQYGLGKAVAFTSDAYGHWAIHWVPWDGFATYWTQVIKYSIPVQTPTALRAYVEQGDKTSTLVVDAQNNRGEFLNGYQLQARLAVPDGSVENLQLHQAAPGQYQAAFIPTQPGVYLFSIQGTPPAGEASQNGLLFTTAGWVLPYSAEYLVNVPSLTSLCNLETDPAACIKNSAEGKSLSPKDMFIGNLDPVKTPQPLWGWLLFAATLLLPIDIAVRRLAITAQDLRLGLNRLAQKLHYQEASPTTSAGANRASTPQVTALLQVKYRVDENRPTSTKLTRDIPADTPEPGKSLVENSLPGQQQSEAPVLPAPPQGSQSEDQASPTTTASKLLASKRDRQRNSQ